MLPDFELYEPRTIEEACRLKKELNARILAGGTDVLVAMHGGESRPDALIDIKNIKELQAMSETEDTLVLGALTTHRAIEDAPFFKKNYTALFEGCSQVGSVQIRYRGTLGGNICNAVPSADSIGPLLVFGALCVISSGNAERIVPLEEFFTGPKHTVLKDDEILKELVLPKPRAGTGSCYIKYTRRRAMDLALCGYSILIALDGQGVITEARVALTTSAPIPIRAKNAEAYLLGKKAAELDKAEFGKISASDAKPRSSWRSSAEFRLTLIEELAGRAFGYALARAKGEEV
ncbi:MAG: FAD binding domain-containing protein [Oscillospiraceae bacterium]